MNTTRIESAIRTIDENLAALKWLSEYGTKLDPRDKDSFDIIFRTHYAGACPGAKEAAKVLAAFARFELPKIIGIAIRNCNNTIAMEKEAMVRAMEDERGEAQP